MPSTGSQFALEIIIAKLITIIDDLGLQHVLNLMWCGCRHKLYTCPFVSQLVLDFKDEFKAPHERAPEKTIYIFMMYQ